MKKSFGTFLMVLILVSSIGSASAAGLGAIGGTAGTISVQYVALTQISAYLSISTSGCTTCSGTVVPSSSSYTSTITVSLQKYSTSGWSVIKSWSGSGTGLAGASAGGNYYVSTGTYRVCSTANVYNSSGTLLETAS
ncbi:MAG: hypothetical protein HGA22_14190, partial [Clostridiales bacterium]|nr:hypothetical protein [Clostridiales bacterium]